MRCRDALPGAGLSYDLLAGFCIPKGLFCGGNRRSCDVGHQGLRCAHIQAWLPLKARMGFLCAGANPAIIVGNAQPTLVDWLVKQPQNSRVVLTDAEIARGILEGLARHGLY